MNTRKRDLQTYIEVAVTLPLHSVYTYRVPKNLVDRAVVGTRVLVPFAKRRVTGYVCGCGQPDDAHAIKSILAVLDEEPLFPENMLVLFRWAATYYIHPLGEVIKTALPSGLNRYDVTAYAITDQGQAVLSGRKERGAVRQLLEALTGGRQTHKALVKLLGNDFPDKNIPHLIARGIIKQEKVLQGGHTRVKLEKFVSCIPGFQPPQRFSEGRRDILAVLNAQGTLPISRLREMIPNATRLVTAMVRSGQIAVENRPVYRDPLGLRIEANETHRLTVEQAQAIAAVAERLGRGFAAFLLAGVTGSGKTEVYMQLTKKVLDRGRSVLVLVPEIVLISQMERRFRARFGACVAVLHSGLSDGERYDQWLRICRQEVTIAIGARSAVFAPFSTLGLVIVDEEHDASYKQGSGLRYNARDLAVVRAQQNDCPVVLGSATPSIQSWYNVCSGKFRGLELTGRVAQRRMPEITTVDLRGLRHARGIERFFTPVLKAAMTTTLERGEQVLLFLNRRGFASHLVCDECGAVVKCRNCDISLTLHHAAKTCSCHYCGFSQAASTLCRTCGSSRIIRLGVGTERIEAAVTVLFPKAVVARMDSDTTARKGAVVRLLKKLHQGRIDILVGTQMVAKGHDFPNITLVGILSADLSLSFPDFRSGARTFQLLAQVAGRAGRGKRPGKVILQTYNPEHFSITAACTQDFKSFYEREIKFRHALHYPPFSRFVQLKISGRKQERVRVQAQLLGTYCRHLACGVPGSTCDIEVLGPIESPVSRIAGRYRWQILLKSSSTAALHRLVKILQAECRQIFSQRDVRIVVGC